MKFWISKEKPSARPTVGGFLIVGLMKKVISQKEAGEYFGVTAAAIRKWIRVGKLNESVVRCENNRFKGIDLDLAIQEAKLYEESESCIKCGKPIGEGLKKYCSKECAGRYLYKNCTQCGNEFYANQTKQQYCSAKCSSIGADRRRPIKPKPVANCAKCGNQFERKIKHQKFCSKDCYSSASIDRRRKPRSGICKYCEKSYFSNRHVYCSEECARSARNKKRKLSDNITRQSLYRRDEFTCIYCGQSSIEDGVRLTADHIVPFNKGGTHTIDNLVTCCKKCNSAKCDSMFDNDIIERVQAVVAKRNELLSLGERASIKQLARRMDTLRRYKR